MQQFNVERVVFGRECRLKVFHYLLADLVVLDAMLPKRSGFLVLEKLKSAKQESKFRIIMITGNQGTRHKTWAENLGVDDYINKPFSMDTLLDKADKLLSN